MKTKKIVALLLCLSMAVASFVLPATATATASDPEPLTGIELLASYGIIPSGGNAADVASAEIVDGALVIKWGDSASYPKLLFSNVPDTLKKYTYQLDFITAEDTNNKANYMTLGKVGSKYQEVGFRTGEYQDTKNFANIIGLGLGSAANTYSFGTANNGVDLTAISNKHPAMHTFIVSIDATEAAEAKVSVTVDGISLFQNKSIDTSENAWSSIVGLSGWKTNTMAYDNISITDDTTGEVVWSANFEPKAPETGDASILPIVAMAVSFAGIVVVTCFKKKKVTD